MTETKQPPKEQLIRTVALGAILWITTPLRSAEPASKYLGFDTGWSPEQTEATLDDLVVNGSHGTWLRIRNMAESPVLAPPEGERGNEASFKGRVGTVRADLAALRERGHRVVAMLRWSYRSWESGTRPHRSHLPIDLKEAYERSHDLAFTYGDLIDAWEIDNEPDISFVPENAETFAAFYKACSLGILDGRKKAQRTQNRITNNQRILNDLAGSADIASRPHFQNQRAASAVMHSPMALPPGPYWQELVANEVLSYTEAFNYHFYGYPEDFRGVRDAWVAALEQAQRVEKHEDSVRKVRSSGSSNPSRLPVNSKSLRYEGPPLASPGFDLDRARRSLPIFLTEYGYGLLDRVDRYTLEGRERQKRFFELTLPSITDGTIAGAMAFVFMPYYERGVNEFGLLAEAPGGLRSGSLAQQSEIIPQEASSFEGEQVDSSTTPSAEPSTQKHPLPIGSDDTFPLLTDGDMPSEVVIDFIASDDTRSVKRYNGHLLERVSTATAQNEELDYSSKPPRSTSSGSFALVLYNFNDEPVTGTIAIALENGNVAQSQDVSARLPPPTSSTDAKRPGKSTKSAVKEDASSEPPSPYRRPDTPRSSLRPPSEPDWPNAETRITITENGKTYAVTPALEFLLQSAGDGEQKTKIGNLEHPAENGEQNSDATPTAPRSRRHTPLASAAAKAESLAFVSNPITLAPMGRRELHFTADLPNEDFRGYRLWAVWNTDSRAGDNADERESLSHQATPSAKADSTPRSTTSNSATANLNGVQPHSTRLATRLYPSPSGFRAKIVDTFSFTAEDNASTRARQIARPRVYGEAELYQNRTARRWLSTNGAKIDETATGWRITINDLPSEPLRPAELELPLPAYWRFPPDAALSLKYRLVVDEPNAISGPVRLNQSEGRSTSGASSNSNTFTKSENSHNRFEEIEINLRDKDGTLWGVWPRLNASTSWQSYFEPIGNFSPMFFSRPAPQIGNLVHQFSDESIADDQNSIEAASLVVLVRPRIIPTIIEIESIYRIELEPIY